MQGHRRWLALAAVALAACAAPSRQLTTRIVEDPITLPKRMASVSMQVTGIRYEPTAGQSVLGTAGFRYGFTDHLEWAGLVGLRYALLDDRPADGRAPMPFSLALRASVAGLGYSSLDGMILQPIISLEALKHISDRWALWLSAEWLAQWLSYESDFLSTPRYNQALFYSARIWSTIGMQAAVTRQLTPRVALGVVPSVAQSTSCLEPWCDWKWRAASLAVVVGVRPLSWLTVRLAPGVGVRHRPDLLLPTTYPDGTPITIQPLTVTWLSLTGWLDTGGVMVIGMGVPPKPDFWVHQGTPQKPHVHVAFRAENRAAVDAFYKAAIAAGGTDNGPPGMRPHYHKDYYGAFVLDPDGHNIEACCHLPEGG